MLCAGATLTRWNNGERAALATDQTSLDTRPHDALEHTPNYTALAEALIARTGEGGVVRDSVFQAQITEPAIGEIDLNLPANLPLRADGEHVADDQHLDHQHRIDRRAADLGVVSRELRIDPGQIQHSSDPPNEMIVRNRLIEAELVKHLPLALLALAPSSPVPLADRARKTESRPPSVFN